MIEARDLTISYNDRIAVSHVTLTLDDGEITSGQFDRYVFTEEGTLSYDERLVVDA